MLPRLLLLIAALALFSIPAKADQVVITSGTVTFGGTVLGATHWSIAGNNFSATGGGDRNSSFNPPGVVGPGTYSVDAGFGFTSADYNLGASVTYNGVTYFNWTGTNPFPPPRPPNAIGMGTQMRFHTVLTVPLVTESIFVETPFTMTGRVGGTNPESGVVLDVSFTGSGIARYRLQIISASPGFAYLTREVVYTFTEVPEPATLLLLSASLSALVIVIARRRKKRS